MFINYRISVNYLLVWMAKLWSYSPRWLFWRQCTGSVSVYTIKLRYSINATLKNLFGAFQVFFIRWLYFFTTTCISPHIYRLLKMFPPYIIILPCMTIEVGTHFEISDWLFFSPSTVKGEAPVRSSYMRTPRLHQSTA